VAGDAVTTALAAFDEVIKEGKTREVNLRGLKT